MQRVAGLIPLGDAGDQGMKTAGPAFLDQPLHKQPADPFPLYPGDK